MAATEGGGRREQPDTAQLRLPHREGGGEFYGSYNSMTSAQPAYTSWHSLFSGTAYIHSG
eukprot:365387-Chlamydomonas_euryale.AAC.23